MIALGWVACRSVEPACLDPDRDGLDSCVERDLGTDPRRPDSDHDGYTDGDEVDAGTDPTDPDSVIYLGGWPYDPDKDALGDPGWDSVAAEGVQVPRFVGRDRFDEPVELYDLAGHGVPVVLDVSAGWCDPCRELAGWLAGGASPTFDAVPAWSTARDRIARGEVLWVTVLFEDSDTRPATAAFAEEWSDGFDDPGVVVLADPDEQLTDWLFPGAYPNVHLVSDAMALQIYDPFGYDRVLDELSR